MADRFSSAAPASRPALCAPAGDGQALIAPPLATAALWVEGNRSRRETEDFPVLGLSRRPLAASARIDLLRRAHRFSSSYRSVEPLPPGDPAILVAGHQPELFHSGVWFKNFVLDSLARELGAVAVNLVVDHDVCRQPSIRVPTGSPEDARWESVLFDQPAAVVPWEERGVVNPDVLANFSARAAQAIRPFVSHPLVDEMWGMVVERGRGTGNLGAALAQGRHAFEAEQGLHTLELPISQICEFDAFRWFVADLLAHLPQRAAMYNAALAEHRRAKRIRSRTHPVPDLQIENDWIEAPLWVWRRDDPTRRAVFARRRGADVVLADRAGWEGLLPRAAHAAGESTVARLAELAAGGVRIRPRALTTTLFARLFLSDLFVHGIGGAKYDELTDVLMTRWFGIDPPRYMVATATMRLPIAGLSLEAAARLGEVRRILRDLTYNPDRHLSDAALLAAGNTSLSGLEIKRRWIERSRNHGDGNPLSGAELRLRHAEIVRANASLQPLVAGERRRLVEEETQLARRLENARVLSSREYSFCLFPREPLVSSLTLLARGAGIAPIR